MSFRPQDCLKQNNLVENVVVRFKVDANTKAFAVLTSHSNPDGSLRTYPGNQPHGGFAHCMACNSFLWPQHPPPAQIPSVKDIKGRLWNSADARLRELDAALAPTGCHARSSSSGGSNKRSSSDGEAGPRPNLPAACVNGNAPSADVRDLQFSNGLCGWMPVAHGASLAANIKAHVSTQGHATNMAALRLLARSGSGLFQSGLPKLVAGVRLCPFLLKEEEQLPCAMPAEAAAGPGAAEMETLEAAAEGAGEEGSGAASEHDEEVDDGLGRYITDENQRPSDWVCCSICSQSHKIAECCLCRGPCYKTINNARKMMFVQCKVHAEYSFNFICH